VLAITSAALMTACSGSDDAPVQALQAPLPAVINDPCTNGAATTANPEARWNTIGTDAIAVAATPGTGTLDEQRPGGSVDLATLHNAIYDAVMAIVGKHEPSATTPADTNPVGASGEAAVAAAPCRLLTGLFQNRAALHQDANWARVSAIALRTVASARRTDARSRLAWQERRHSRLR
jgi:hypothetical protein